MAAMPETFQSQKGMVASVINIPEFTYLEVSQDNQTRWIVAASVIEVKKGDVIEFDSGTTVKNFTSKTLNRTFPSIAFVNHVNIVKK
ncbi:MAG: NrfJ [Gallionella sp.]